MKKNYKTPEERAKQIVSILLAGKITYMHISKRNNTKEEREQILNLTKSLLKVLGIELDYVRSKYTIRIRKDNHASNSIS